MQGTLDSAEPETTLAHVRIAEQNPKKTGNSFQAEARKSDGEHTPRKGGGSDDCTLEERTQLPPDQTPSAKPIGGQGQGYNV